MPAATDEGYAHFLRNQLNGRVLTAQQVFGTHVIHFAPGVGMVGIGRPGLIGAVLGQVMTRAGGAPRAARSGAGPLPPVVGNNRDRIEAATRITAASVAVGVSCRAGRHTEWPAPFLLPTEGGLWGTNAPAHCGLWKDRGNRPRCAVRDRDNTEPIENERGHFASVPMVTTGHRLRSKPGLRGCR